MRTIIDELRSRKSDWTGNSRLAPFDRHFETLASFYGGAAAKRAEIAKDVRLSPQGVSEKLAEWLNGGINAEVTKVTAAIELERKNIALRRADLAKPKFEPTDMAGALMRQEIRAWLRTLNPGEQLAALTKDASLAAAALEAPPALSGLPDDIRAHVVNAYLEATAGPEVKALEQAEEGLQLVATMARAISMDVSATTSARAAA